LTLSSCRLLAPDGKVVRTDVFSLVRGSVMTLDTQYKMYKDIGD